MIFFFQLDHLPNISSLLRCFHQNGKNTYFKYLWSSRIFFDATQEFFKLSGREGGERKSVHRTRGTHVYTGSTILIFSFFFSF